GLTGLLAAVVGWEARAGGSGPRPAVMQVKLDLDEVAVAVEAVDLGDGEAVLAARLQAHFEQVLASLERAFAGLRAPQSVVIGPRFAREAALRLVAVLGPEEHKVLGGVVGVLVLEQLKPLQRPAQRVALGHEHV